MHCAVRVCTPAELGVQRTAAGLAALATVYGRCGAAYLALRSIDHSLLMYDRQLQLSTETQHSPSTAVALEGLAR